MAESLTRPPREEPRFHRLRFGLAYLALAVCAGGAAGATILLLDQPGKGPGTAWSDWKPTGDEDEGTPKEIADYVGGRYRLPSGSPLVGILAGPPKVQSIDVRAVAIRPEEGTSDDIEIISTEGGLMYVLCGLGEACAISEGEATQERHRLLRRQALELALYTFKYVDDVGKVIALLPPNPEAESGTAIFFQKDDFEHELKVPLSQTLSLRDPPISAELDPAEGLIVDRLTRPRLFSYEFQAAQDGSPVIVLAPVVVQR